MNDFSKNLSQIKSNNARSRSDIFTLSKPFLLFTIFLFSFCLFLLTPNQANANMFNRFKKRFYFEKYSNTQEAQKALLELHAIGSKNSLQSQNNLNQTTFYKNQYQ
ncbi:MAG: hypothetical protein V4612_06815 [Pseudomonadota bacterium]